MPTMPSFFRRYADAYLAFEPQGLKAFFALPCIIIDNRGDHVIRVENDLLTYEKSFVEALKNKAVSRIESTIINEQAMGREACCCSVRYRLQDRYYQLLGDFEYHYLLVVNGTDWRIKCAKMGEVHRWNMEH